MPNMLTATRPLPRALARTPVLRRENAWTVFEVLRADERSRSAPELASETGLTRPTVDAALEMLDQKGWLKAAGAAPSQGGRPAALFEAAPEGAWVVALSFYLPEICGVVLDLRGRVVAEAGRRVPGNASASAALGALDALLGELLQAGDRAFGLARRPRLAAVAVAVAGTLSPDRRVSRTLARVQDWQDVPLAERIEAMLAARGLSAPALLDRYLSALGRSLTTSESDGPVLCMEVAAGVGVGLGSSAGVGVNAGEFGFTLLDPNGPSDATGRRGTVEAFLADAQVEAACNAALKRRPPKDGTTNTNFYVEIGCAAEAQHPFADVLALRFAQALANLSALFAPERIEVRGAVAQAGAAFHELVLTKFRALAVNPCALDWAPVDVLAPAVALGREVLAARLRRALLTNSVAVF